MFVLENLDNLRKNGRLTRMQSIVTGALRVKLLCGATPEGEIQKLGQGLTVRQTLAKMVGRMAEDQDHVERRLVIAHCNCLERAETVREMVRQKCRFGEILTVATGGIATVYANDGGIVTAY
jgi:fatty acid-binding protein DegV